MAKKTIKAQMKQRRDTKANWASANPVLLDGELGIVSDDPNLYKVGDGSTAWNSLPFRGFDGTLAQELGTSENAVISQKVVSEKLTELESKIIPLVGLYANSKYYVPNWKVGDVMYNTSTKKLRRCVSVDSIGDASSFEDIEFINSAIYSSHGVLWGHDGKNLFPYAGVIEIKSVTNSSPLDGISQFYYSKTHKKLYILASSVEDDIVYAITDASKVLLVWENALYKIDEDGELKNIPYKDYVDELANAIDSKFTPYIIENKNIATLSFIGVNGSDYAPNWKVGDVMYNTSTKKLRRCVSVDSNGDASSFEDYIISQDCLLRYNEYYYVIDQDGLKNISSAIRLHSIVNADEIEVGQLYYSSVNRDIRIKVNQSHASAVRINAYTLLRYSNKCYVLDAEGNLVVISGGKGERGEKGEQGNSGYTGTSGELEVVNNLTQGGATSALSAEQGKILNRWKNYNASSPILKKQNKKSITKVPLSAWGASDSFGSVGSSTVKEYDDAIQDYVEAKLCASNNSATTIDGARFVAKLPQAVDMTYNILRGSVCQDIEYPIADLGNISISLYSDNTIDSAHRAYIVLNYGYNGSNDASVRSGWHHFCVNLPLMGEIGSSFNTVNVTHVSFNVNHAPGTELKCYVGEWDVIPNMIKPGIVTIIDNFNPNVPAMADYAAQKGVKLNLSIVPNWVGDDSKHGTLQEIYDAANQGHFIFNHTWNHQIYGGQTEIEVYEQIDKANQWMVEHGFIRGAKVLSVPSAAFDNQKYKAFLGSEAAMVYHHWTPLVSPTKRSDDSTKCILYYPYKGMERLLNISMLDSYYIDNFPKLTEAAILGAEAALQYGGILVVGFHGYGTNYGGYMPDDTTWKAYIDTIASLNIHHYTIDELIEGCFM